MSAHWTSARSARFWNNRQIQMITRNDRFVAQTGDMINAQAERERREEALRHAFVQNNANSLANNVSPPYVGQRTAQDLEFWMIHMSWTYCSTCQTISPRKLLPAYSTKHPLKHATACKCKENRYVVPKTSDIPRPLQQLSTEEVEALRPLKIHSGTYERAQHGYRRKNDILRITWSQINVESQIQQLQNATSQQRCYAAYAYLMQSEESCYKDFVQKRQAALEADSAFNLYNHVQSAGVECALWPNLYPKRAWCETISDGRESRLSTKVAFLTKVCSGIVDYGLFYDLLQFHYDLWLFRTVCGAITTGRRLQCSPARALESKTFSTGYWRWEHRCLLDAVQQFGFPKIFLTISPFEWSFPFPEWLNRIRALTARGPTQLSAFETMHMAHVLEQVVRGYLCGSNTNTWKAHVFGNARRPAVENVQTFFYRFEFQKRGTAHLHLLIWIEDVSQMRYNLIRADVPWSNPEIAQLVHKLQGSDKSCLPVQEKATHVVQDDNQSMLQIRHPRDAFEMHLRAYIASLVPSLKCRMDIQTTDGQGMLLRYVTSYVTKSQDAYSNDALYSLHVTPFQAAYRHLKEMKPLEPEMWLALSATKATWSPSRRKRFAVPTSTTLNVNSTHRKYCARPYEDEQVSLLQWLRDVDESKTPPKKYKRGVTLVGVKTRSPFQDEYFFQYLLLHVPHRSTEVFFHRDFRQLPPQLRFFAAALSFDSQLWNDDTVIEAHFTKEGHRNHFIATLVAHIASLRNLYLLCQREVFGSNIITATRPPTDALFPDPQQSSILRTFQQMTAGRDAYYNTMDCFEDPPTDEDHHDVDDAALQYEELPVPQMGQCIDWKKFLLVTGKPGTGKSHILRMIINECITTNQKVIVTVPTGFLATQYKAEFDDSICTDTIHSAFRYPILPAEKPTINWSIANYDVLIIDELSMVSTRIFDHIMKTVNEIPIRPIAVLCGDECQQQPIERCDSKTVQARGIMHDARIHRVVQHFKLTVQHRSTDEQLTSFLNHIRYWRPTATVLDSIQTGRILSAGDEPTDEEIISALQTHPTATVLTVTRVASNRINALFIQHLHGDDVPLATIPTDCELGTIDVFLGLRVMITQNRDKANRIVNGQQGVICGIQNKTIFIKLPNRNVIQTHLVTCETANGQTKTTYPIMPCYSLTICKAQGQTLETCIVWFDILQVPPGTAYVALSRVTRLNNLFFLTAMKPEHFTPVTM